MADKCVCVIRHPEIVDEEDDDGDIDLTNGEKEVPEMPKIPGQFVEK